MKQLLLLALTIPTLSVAGTAFARPIGPHLFCETYPDSPGCAGRTVECTTCHTSTWPPAWNEFGYQVLGALEDDFEVDLPRALASIEGDDADGDGVANIHEIEAGTAPGDPEDFWLYCPPEPMADGPVPVAESYDFERALRKLSIRFCGRSPTYDELVAFRGDEPERRALYDRVHAELDACLSSVYWRDEALSRLADAKIRPISAVGIDSTVGIVIGDYEWDYRLFSYVMTEERDVRDLLLADYHVRRTADGTLERVEGTFPSPRGGAGGQPLVADKRAGMITSQWFLSVNTMFSPLPRTTAAQAYRAYLGMDIARQEGLLPIAGEPADVDGKGVTDPACAQCHSTLDPLSYAFASYQGIRGADTGTYVAERPSALIPGWGNNQSYLLGEPVDDVRSWAERAVTTDEFKRNLAMMIFRYAEDREPTPVESRELEAVWRALPEDGWSMNRMIHRLVDTPTFGGAR
jgi:hypothetical protein